MAAGEDDVPRQQAVQGRAADDALRRNDDM
jgi:hypothetical protein